LIVSKSVKHRIGWLLSVGRLLLVVSLSFIAKKILVDGPYTVYGGSGGGGSGGGGGGVGDGRVRGPRVVGWSGGGCGYTIVREKK